MAPRENDNNPPEDRPGETPAAEREWERLWEQDEDAGGGDVRADVGVESGDTARAEDEGAGSGCERAAEAGAETQSARGLETANEPMDTPSSDPVTESAGSVGRDVPEPVAEAESAPTDSPLPGEEPRAPRSEHSATGAHAEAPEPTDTAADDVAPTATPAHDNADEPASSHDHGNADGPAHTHHHHDGSTHAHHHDSPNDAPAPNDERVAAVRRVAAAGRRWRALQLAGCAALLAVALTGGAIAIGAAKDSGATTATNSSAVSPELLASGSLDASIASLQAHLRGQPKDFDGWATLGLAYVEQARTKGDPSRYPQAQAAFARSLKISPDNENALEGRAALAAARHEFKEALTYADQVLKENPYSERALCSRIDALVELGRYDEASKAADLADARKPGVPVFTRYAYVHELRGDVTTARSVLERALAAATSPGDISYVAATLGQLAWNQGDYKTALNDYGRALAADENYLPALEGRARAQAALGDRADAIKGMELVVSRYPLPQPLVELGELYESRGAEGDKAKADDQYALVDAWIALARANGVNADLDTALAAADHGDIKSALRAARAEWARRHTVHTADALAWALHVNGLDKEALAYARFATATGYHNASFIYHLGVIELATGHKADGRAHLTKALKLNPGFSPLGASKARKALEATK